MDKPDSPADPHPDGPDPGGQASEDGVRDDAVVEVVIDTQGGPVTKRLEPGDTLERSTLTIRALGGDFDD